MRISDWSSDVCSSDLVPRSCALFPARARGPAPWPRAGGREAPGGGPARRLAAGECVRRRGGPPARCGRRRWLPTAPVRPAIDRSGSKRVHPELAALDLAGAPTRQRLFRLLARDVHVVAGGVDVALDDRVHVQAGIPGGAALNIATAPPEGRA